MEMEFCDAVDLFTDMTAAIAPSAGALVGGIASRGLALGEIAKEVAGGKLTAYLARVLATTTLIVPSEKLKVELINSREQLNKAFTGRAKLIYPAVKLALEVSFKDFLDDEWLSLLGLKIPTKTTESSPEDSSPSMSAIG